MLRFQTLTTDELTAYAERVDLGVSRDVRSVLRELHTKGYGFAGWICGLGRPLTRDGTAPVGLYAARAIMGWDGDLLRLVPDTQLRHMREEMAARYIQALLHTAVRYGGEVAQDLPFLDALHLHELVLNGHRLSLDNWSMCVPMALLRRARGDDAVEAIWCQLRDTGGSGLEAVLASVKAHRLIGEISRSAVPGLSEEALAWLQCCELTRALNTVMTLKRARELIEDLIVVENLLQTSRGGPPPAHRWPPAHLDQHGFEDSDFHSF